MGFKIEALIISYNPWDFTLLHQVRIILYRVSWRISPEIQYKLQTTDIFVMTCGLENLGGPCCTDVRASHPSLQEAAPKLQSRSSFGQRHPNAAPMFFWRRRVVQAQDSYHSGPVLMTDSYMSDSSSDDGPAGAGRPAAEPNTGGYEYHWIHPNEPAPRTYPGQSLGSKAGIFQGTQLADLAMPERKQRALRSLRQVLRRSTRTDRNTQSGLAQDLPGHWSISQPTWWFQITRWLNQNAPRHIGVDSWVYTPFLDKVIA